MKCDGLTNNQFYQKVNEMDISEIEKVKLCLIQNGWNGKKRREGITVLEDMKIFGFYAFPLGQLFLERFGGMKIDGAKCSAEFIKHSQTLRYYIQICKQLKLDQIAFLEALQIKKNELMIPIGKEDRYWDISYIYWGESGKVYYSCEDFVGIIAPNLFSYFAQIFGFEKQPQRDARQEEAFVDYDWYEEIENKIDKGDYVFYAQKRFTQNMGQPNPITTSDEFIKWLITISEDEECICENDIALLEKIL